MAQLNSTFEPFVTLFGEVLFDSFEHNGSLQYVLGGAPFNICWHLQALGDHPTFISRVGRDALGDQIITQAQDWGIATDTIQIDNQNPTGLVQVTFDQDEPNYEIKQNSAYDFIETSELALPHRKGILYHGSLALRSDQAKQQFKQLVASGQWHLFLDVNLRVPWWDKASLVEWIKQARWVKLNIDELRQLGYHHANIEQAITDFKHDFGNEQVIVTQGADGVTVLTDNGFVTETPDLLDQFVDTVGAGDAFTAVYIHGLLNQWPLSTTLTKAQQLASHIIGIRGATPDNPAFYQFLFSTESL